jgi:hypothetical protein
MAWQARLSRVAELFGLLATMRSYPGWQQDLGHVVSVSVLLRMGSEGALGHRVAGGGQPGRRPARRIRALQYHLHANEDQRHGEHRAQQALRHVGAGVAADDNTWHGAG